MKSAEIKEGQDGSKRIRELKTEVQQVQLEKKLDKQQSHHDLN